jgi:hypothetical protein
MANDDSNQVETAEAEEEIQQDTTPKEIRVVTCDDQLPQSSQVRDLLKKHRAH